MSVSRRHAEVVLTADGRYFITDRASTGGTFVRDSSGWRQIQRGFITSANQLRLGNHEISASRLECLRALESGGNVAVQDGAVAEDGAAVRGVISPKPPRFVADELDPGKGLVRDPETGEIHAARQPRGSPGKVFRDCEECPEMVVLPAGSFQMGSPFSEEGRDNDEGPQHQVEIAQSFAVGKYAVTRGEFSRFVSATGHSTGNSCWTYEDGEWKDRSGRNWRSPGFIQSEQDPVVGVSWEDAQGYVGWLSRKTGKEYRLLTEAEWEYAARAGTIGPFHFGGTISTDQANYDGNRTYGTGCKGVYRKKTVAVGVFPANAFGLHDMHGNVWEWVEDCWHASYAGAPVDGSAWTKGGDCGLRLLRGGSWLSSPGSLRAAYRVRSDAVDRSSDNGFRVARTLAP